LSRTSKRRKLIIKSRFVIPLMVIAALVFLSQPAIADDLADLGAAHQRHDQAWSTGDLNTVFEIWQDGGI
jgi:hypothetical protein